MPHAASAVVMMKANDRMRNADMAGSRWMQEVGMQELWDARVHGGLRRIASLCAFG